MANKDSFIHKRALFINVYEGRSKSSRPDLVVIRIKLK